MNVIEDNSFTRSLAAWGKRLPRPRAIMVISAHWLTGGTFAGCMERPKTIHDFYGFHRALYAKQYPSPGAPAEAEFAAGLVRKAAVRCRSDWGIDHGAWSVLVRAVSDGTPMTFGAASPDLTASIPATSWRRGAGPGPHRT